MFLFGIIVNNYIYLQLDDLFIQDEKIAASLNSLKNDVIIPIVQSLFWQKIKCEIG